MPTPVITKKHLYKVFRGATYIGVIPNVRSDFEYEQEVNTGSASLEITIGVNPDRSTELVEPLQTEAGQDLQTEAGDTIYIDKQPEIVGLVGSGVLIANGNTVEVYEISDYDPNGVLVFKGEITRWSARYGEEDDISVTVISQGVDLRDYIMQTAGAFIAEIEQETNDQTVQLNTQRGGGKYQAIFQVFTPTVDITIVKLQLQMRRGSGVSSADFVVDLGAGNDPQTADYVPFYAYQVVRTLTNPDFDWIDVSFPQPVTFSAGQPYVIAVGTRRYLGDPTFQDFDVGVNSAGGYAGGGATTWNDNYPSPDTWTAQSYDLAFRLLSTNNSIRAAYTSDDPAEIFRDAIDVYQANGGLIGYTPESVDNTNLSINYTFNLNTLLEAIEKARELAPGDWYWYIDPASLTAHFKQTLTTPTHKFVKGTHIQSLDLTALVENIRNRVYLTGGNTGSGVNLFAYDSNNDSITSLGKPRLQRLSDIGITDLPTAQQRITNYLESHDSEDFTTTVNIIDSSYDTNSVNLGDTIALIGFNNFIDSLVLQIVRKRVMKGALRLVVGVLPFDQTRNVDQIKKDVEQIKVVDNPDAPS